MVLKRQFLLMLATLAAALALLIPLFGERSGAAERHPRETVTRGSDGSLYAAGELIVVYKDGAKVESTGRFTASSKGLLNRVEDSVAEADGARVSDALPDLDAEVVEFPEVAGETSGADRETSLEEIKSDLERDPSVERVYYNYLRTGMSVPNDPQFRRQYALRTVHFPAAWNRAKRGARVAVVDSGVAVNHVELKGKVIARHDFHNNNSTVEDLAGHGTFISGIVAAKTNNRKGIAGACPKCTIIAAKALGKNLVGYDSDIARAIDWSVKRGAKVVNLSLGGLGEKSVMKDAIDRANRNGAVVVAAGGNYGNSKKVYPAAYGNVIGAAYTGPRDRTSSHSSYGTWQDVAAPGVDIFSTVPGGYDVRSGSSFSSPHVAALAGLLRGQGRSHDATIKRIKRTADDLGARGKDPYFGYGRINAARATRR